MNFQEIINKIKNNEIIIIIILILLLLLYYVNTPKTQVKTQNVSEEVKRTNIPENKEIKINNIEQFTESKTEFAICYTNWCGWSKRMLALLNSDEFKKEFEKVSNKCNIKYYDCEADGTEICTKHNISGFPTLKLIKPSGESMEYNGDRTPDAIVAFINKNS